MSDVTLSYKGSDILELSNSGSATLKTGGTYCEADIEVEYVKPSGGGSLPSGVTKIVTGTFTLAEDTNEYTITHNLGAKTNLILVFARNADASLKDYNKNKIVSYAMYIPSVTYANSVCAQQKYIYPSSGNIIGASPSFAFANHTTTTSVIKGNGSSVFASTWSDGNGNETPVEYFWLCALCD